MRPPWEAVPPRGQDAALRLSLSCQVPRWLPFLPSVTNTVLGELPVFLVPPTGDAGLVPTTSARALLSPHPSSLFRDKPWDLVLSYIVRDTSAEGDGYVFALRDKLTALGYSVFVCEADIRGGEDFWALIGEAIRRCRCFVAVLSSNYGNSHYTLLEAKMAVRRKLQHGKPLIRLVQHSGDFDQLPAELELMWSATNVVPKGRYGTAAEFEARGEGQLVIDELIESLRADGVHPSDPPPPDAAPVAAAAAPAGAHDAGAV